MCHRHKGHSGFGKWLTGRALVASARARGGAAVQGHRGTATDRGRGAAMVEAGWRGSSGQVERLANDHSSCLAAEEFIERAVVDGDLAAAVAQENASSGSLSSASAVVS